MVALKKTKLIEEEDDAVDRMKQREQQKDNNNKAMATAAKSEDRLRQEELLTRTSWVNARVALNEIRKVGLGIRTSKWIVI